MIVNFSVDAVRPCHSIEVDTPGCRHWAGQAEARTE